MAARRVVAQLTELANRVAAASKRRGLRGVRTHRCPLGISSEPLGEVDVRHPRDVVALDLRRRAGFSREPRRVAGRARPRRHPRPWWRP